MGADHRKIIGWGLLGLLLLFILINLEPVEVNFFFILRVKMPVAFVLFVSTALGAAAVFALQYYKQMKKDGDPPK